MNDNLPVVQKSNLPANIKKGAIKLGKIVGHSVLFGASSTALVLGIAAFPILIPPAFLASLYTSQKLLNETIYQSHKDVAFITGKHNGNVKIYQDVVRPDITLQLRGMSPIEKAAFMQLQAIVGISKLNRIDKKGNTIQFETDTHSVVQKAIKKLESVGFIENYFEEPKKTSFTHKNMESRLILPKLAFGNVKGLTEKTPIYNVKFQLGEKKIDINDPNLQKVFPGVFSKKRGLLAKYNYNIIQNPDGTLSIDYHAKKPFIQRVEPSSNLHRTFSDSLSKDAPSLQEQKDFSISFQERNSKDLSELNRTSDIQR